MGGMRLYCGNVGGIEVCVFSVNLNNETKGFNNEGCRRASTGLFFSDICPSPPNDRCV